VTGVGHGPRSDKRTR
jgi:hypothetical protein